MKSERLLSMLLLLQARGRLSARQIAGSLEVSERTVYRDLDSLSAAGVPVHAERGARGGIVLADGYRRALTQLRDDEVRALFVSAAETLADVGLGDNLAKALEKLTGALSDSQRRAATHARARIRLDPRRWKQAAQPRDHLAALRLAASENRCVLLHYRDRNGKVTQRSIDPFGLVAKAGVWYLVARYGNEMRVFRAERILGLDVTTDRFERPAAFDLDTFWREWIENVERNTPSYPVILLVAPEAFREVTDWWESETLSADAGRGWHRVRLLFPALEVALAHIVTWGDRVRLVGPDELRSALIARARDVLRTYAKARRVKRAVAGQSRARSERRATLPALRRNRSCDVS